MVNDGSAPSSFDYQSKALASELNDRNKMVGEEGLEPSKEQILSLEAVPFATISHAHNVLYVFPLN